MRFRVDSAEVRAYSSAESRRAERRNQFRPRKDEGMSVLRVYTVAWAVAVFLLSAAGAFAQEPVPEGKLEKFINPETKDVLTKLEVVQQTLYEEEQLVSNLTFLRLYGERIDMNRVWIPNYDKELTPAYVFTAKNLQKTKKYPALVEVHGAYHGNFDVDSFDLVVKGVEKGYVVIFPEYRGSKGYGAEHYNAIDYGGKELDDVLASVDYIGSKEFVDPARIGIHGISHGGMIALLAIERAPKKFKAAVDNVGLTDFVAYMSYKPNYRREDVAKEPRFKGLPFENLPAYMDVSPINHVDDIQTPLLILATTGDQIAPVQLHSGRLIDALKARGKTFESKIYDHAPGGHLFSFADDAESRDAAERTFEFFGKYLRP
jgi:dipeptidyl aminopeptidase/acylaminoacyl peptidase